MFTGQAAASGHYNGRYSLQTAVVAPEPIVPEAVFTVQ